MGKKAAFNKDRERRDIYKEVTDRIVAQLEAGGLPWWKPDWKTSAGSVPCNGVSGHAYRGLNQLLLWSVANEKSRGQDVDPRFVTFNQAKEKGWHVRKGEKGTPVYFFKRLMVGGSGPSENGKPSERLLDKIQPGVGASTVNQDEEQSKQRPIWFLRSFAVFHASQIEGMPEYKPQAPDWVSNEKVEEILNALEGQGMTYRNGGNQAFYSPRRDHLQMPDKISFGDDDVAYAATLAHELAHATGHNDRLARKMLYSPKTDTESYAKEELVAEMASAMICSSLGVRYASERHASYINTWIDALKGDKKLAMVAAGQAASAVDYLIDQVPGLAEEIRLNRLASLKASQPDDEFDVEQLSADEPEADGVIDIADMDFSDFDVETIAALPDQEFLANPDQEWAAMIDGIDANSFFVEEAPTQKKPAMAMGM